MSDKLKEFEQFFTYDLKIKQLIAIYPEIYDNQSIINYLNVTHKNLQEIKYMFEKMFQFIHADEKIIKYLNKLFRHYERKLLTSIFTKEKIIEFYQTCIANMDPALIDKINKKNIGYYVHRDIHIILECKTINELLHFLHSYVVNNEYFYEEVPIIEEKNEEFPPMINIKEIKDFFPEMPAIEQPRRKKYIALRGCENPIAKALFDMIDFSLGSDFLDIIALNNKILIMARDLGHALTIEIELENEKCYVSYFIPVVLDIDRVNQLQGITSIKKYPKVSRIPPYAKGSFETSYEELLPNLLNLMNNVPTENDARAFKR